MDDFGHDQPETSFKEKIASYETRRRQEDYDNAHRVSWPSVEIRLYLPTLSELIDRLSIVHLKSIFIPQHRDAYLAERRLIEHDIDSVLKEKQTNGYAVDAGDITAIMALMLTNRFIWENESKAREGGAEQDKLLKLTHSINGVRNTAKNVLAGSAGDRVDHKIDCFAAELVEQFGNWNIFDGG